MVQNQNTVKSISTDYFIAKLRADGIVHVHVIENTLITIEVQNEMAKAYNEITDVSRPFIFTGGEFVSITSKARKNAIEMESSVPLSVNAIIVRNLAQRIIADYYYKFNKPINPYKVFNDFDKGIEWIASNFEIPPLPNN